MFIKNVDILDEHISIDQMEFISYVSD